MSEVFHVHTFAGLNGPPVLVACFWHPVLLTGGIGFCMKQADAEKIAATKSLPEGDRTSVLSALKMLPKSSPELAFTLRGRYTGSFIGLVNDFKPLIGRIVARPHTKPVFWAMWPPDADGTAETTLMWFTPRQGYEVGVVFSVEQFEALVHELDSANLLNDQLRAEFKANKWRVEARRGEVWEPIRVTGSPARIICIGSMVIERAKM